ncbi:SLBB domain-containing protein [Larkinella humicola]|uniref:Sugar transporter n=1 Tax=Larkinella humicola TaxID=2607654 RepID=A0A5N1JD37_9BACT|nr:sugar transporter [Larkinella humicola]
MNRSRTQSYWLTPRDSSFLLFRQLPALSFFFLLIAVTAGFAQQPSRADQLNDEQIIEFYQRAQGSGLTEMQIEQAAMSQGYTLTDIAKMRQRMAKIRQQSNRTGQFSVDTLINRAQQGTLSQRPYALGDSLNLLRRDTIRRPYIFGAALFQGTALTFEPNLRIATPRNYVVGPDDELVVEIYGNSTESFRLRVSPEGSVRMLNLAPIFVSGLTIEQAEQRIVGRLRQAFQGLNRPNSGTYASVTLGNIRSIRVTMVGEVVMPGTYTLSSLSTAFNALYLAGGPNPETGSFRDIQVIRNNRVVRTIDLYDYLLRADKKDDIRLLDQDVIRVNDYGVRVEMVGQVKRPAIYEVKSGETLKNVLSFAGGFTDRAYTFSITLRRNTPRELRISTITQDQIATFIPQSGDKYTTGEILNRYENRVQVSGAIMRPGDYALGDEITTVRSLISRAEGLRKDAFLNRAVLYRERENTDLEAIPFDVGRLMRNETEDIPLARQDSVHIYSVRDLREPYYVSIEGAVNRPDTIPYVTNLTVTDLIALSGGFQEGATPNRIEIARRIREDTTKMTGGETVQVFQFSIDRNLNLLPADARFPLRPFDVVYVRTSPRYELQQNVAVFGEVMHPGNYAIESRSERISDVLRRVGGLKAGAFLPGARFSRRGTPIATDLGAILEDPGVSGNLLLEVGDSLIIPKRPETVSIQGAVLNPSTISYTEGFSFKDYVTQAGGYTDNARQKRTYVVYANGLKDRTKRFLFFRKYPKIEPGSRVIVPFEPLNDQRPLTPGERIGLISVLGTMTITLTTVIINLVRLF